MSKIQKDIYQTFYLGYHHRIITPIAISTNRDLVEEYMDRHRNLSHKQYFIQEFEYTVGEIMLDYADSLIEKYEDWFIPNVDIEMISVTKRDLEKDVNDTLEGMKTILLLMQNIKKIPIDDKKTVLRSIEVIADLKEKKKIWNKMVDEYKLTDLIFMDFEEYWSKRVIYINMREARERWEFGLEDNKKE